MSDAAWNFAGTVVTLVVAPSVMWYLNRKQTQKLTQGQAELRQASEDQAAEVKAELAVASSKMDVMHQSVSATERTVNGQSEQKDARIKRLEQEKATLEEKLKRRRAK